MSYFAEVTHAECVNRMIAIKDTERERSAMELRAIQSLPSAVEEYLARGGKVKQLPAMAMQDPEGEEGKQLRKDVLRQYDYNREMMAIRDSKMANNKKQDTKHDRFMRFPEVYERVGLSRSQIHLMVEAGKFPAPVKIGLRASGWLESSIDKWMADIVAISNTNGKQ
jgi:prophage regulatory protein